MKATLKSISIPKCELSLHYYADGEHRYYLINDVVSFNSKKRLFHWTSLSQTKQLLADFYIEHGADGMTYKKIHTGRQIPFIHEGLLLQLASWVDTKLTSHIYKAILKMNEQDVINKLTKKNEKSKSTSKAKQSQRESETSYSYSTEYDGESSSTPQRLTKKELDDCDGLLRIDPNALTQLMTNCFSED